MAAARRLATFAAVSLLAALAGGARAAAPAAAVDQDMSLGSPKAPVTVLEYASPTCPHCAHFRADVFPAFKAKYVDTGKVRLVLREAPIHPELDAPIFLLARCAGPAKYFEVLDAIMKAQPEFFAAADDPNKFGQVFRTVLLRTAQSAGLNEQQAVACMSDEAQLKKLEDRTEAETKEYGVEGTPTFVVDGVKLDFTKPADMAALDAAIQPELAKKQAAVHHKGKR